MASADTTNRLLIAAWDDGYARGAVRWEVDGEIEPVTNPYRTIEGALHEDWCHWGKACCGCKCGAVEFGTHDPSTDEADEDEDA